MQLELELSLAKIVYMNTNEFYEESLLARFPLKFDQLTAVKTVAAMLGLVP